MIDGGSGIELRDKCVEYGWLAKVRRSVLSCAWSVAVPMLRRSFNYFHAIKKVPTAAAKATIERLPSSEGHSVPNIFSAPSRFSKKKKAATF